MKGKERESPKRSHEHGQIRVKRDLDQLNAAELEALRSVVPYVTFQEDNHIIPANVYQNYHGIIAEAWTNVYGIALKKRDFRGLMQGLERDGYIRLVAEPVRYKKERSNRKLYRHEKTYEEGEDYKTWAEHSRYQATEELVQRRALISRSAGKKEAVVGLLTHANSIDATGKEVVLEREFK